MLAMVQRFGRSGGISLVKLGYPGGARSSPWGVTVHWGTVHAHSGEPPCLLMSRSALSAARRTLLLPVLASAASAAPLRRPPVAGRRRCPPSCRPASCIDFVVENHSLGADAGTRCPTRTGSRRPTGTPTSYFWFRYPVAAQLLAMASGIADLSPRTLPRRPSSPSVGRRSSAGPSRPGTIAAVYADAMPGNVLRAGVRRHDYAVKHNPWSYFSTSARAAPGGTTVPVSALGAGHRATAPCRTPAW